MCQGNISPTNTLLAQGRLDTLFDVVYANSNLIIEMLQHEVATHQVRQSFPKLSLVTLCGLVASVSRVAPGAVLSGCSPFLDYFIYLIIWRKAVHNCLYLICSDVEHVLHITNKSSSAI